MFIQVKDVFCPRCHAPEVDEATGLLFIRGLKVWSDDRGWASHCMRCHTWFSDHGPLEPCDDTCSCHESYPVKNPNPFIIVYEEA